MFEIHDISEVLEKLLMKIDELERQGGDPKDISDLRTGLSQMRVDYEYLRGGVILSDGT